MLLEELERWKRSVQKVELKEDILGITLTFLYLLERLKATIQIIKAKKT